MIAGIQTGRPEEERGAVRAAVRTLAGEREAVQVSAVRIPAGGRESVQVSAVRIPEEERGAAQSAVQVPAEERGAVLIPAAGREEAAA